eukprot:m.94257 g.94257  ORF g.94257 m.94257 type:complete len:642 (+) comp13435_c1_seq1:91-2016(+)
MASKRKARDFSHLLDSAPKYTPQVPKDVDPDATVVEPDMASIMGFGSFGVQVDKQKKKQKEVTDKLLAATKRDKQIEAVGTAPKPDSDEDDDYDEDSDEDDDDGGREALEGQDPFGIPASHEVELRHSTKSLVALDLDPAGARLVTGSLDTELKMWDFAAMDVRMKPFRTHTPMEGAQVRCLKYSNSGDLILVCLGNAKPQIIDRDGFAVLECLKGDQYIMDQSKTYGHTSTVNDAVWHPTRKNIFATASSDSSIRVWNTDENQLNNTLKSQICGKCRAPQGKRAPCLCVAFSPDGKMIVTGCEGGGIHTFGVGVRALMTKAQMQKAHTHDVTCLVFNRSGDALISRSKDGTVKKWNARLIMKGPLNVSDKFPCTFDMTSVSYSPNEKYILTGTNGGDDHAGVLYLLNADNLDTMHKIGVSDKGIIRVMWHSRLNQILTSTTEGKVHVLYDPVKSSRGAKLCVQKGPRKASPLDALGIESFGDIKGAVFAPHVHENYKRDDEERRQTRKRRNEKARKDKLKSRKPDMPLPKSDKEFSLGRQGMIRGYAPTLSMHLARQTSYDRTRDEDPREAILKFAEIAEKDPKFVNSAYQMFGNPTEPELDMDYESEEEPKDRNTSFNPEVKPFAAKNRGNELGGGGGE